MEKTLIYSILVHTSVQLFDYVQEKLPFSLFLFVFLISIYLVSLVIYLIAKIISKKVENVI